MDSISNPLFNEFMIRTIPEQRSFRKSRFTPENAGILPE